jgi:hypothetical protein
MTGLMTPDGLLIERRPVDAFFPGRIPALVGGTCGHCGRSVADKSQWSETDVSEYVISSTCPPCWSAMFPPEEEDDES